MATIDNYKIKIDVEGQQAVNQLATSIGAVSIAASAFAGLAIKMADGLSDIAKASGITSGKVYHLSNAIEQAGGKFEDAGNIIAKFYGTLDDAANGSDKAQDALQRLGIPLSDLTKLSEGQLLDKAISQLAGMDAGARRTALGVEIFGKAFKTIDPKQLQDALDSGDAEKLTRALDDAADAVGAMEQNFRTLQVAALQLMQPIIGEVKNLTLTADQAEKIVKILAVTMGLAFGATMVAQIIAVAKAIKTLGVVAGAVGKNPLIKALAVIAAGGALTGSVMGDDIPEPTMPEMPNAPATAGGGTKPAFAEVQESNKTKQRREQLQQAKNQTDQLVKQNEQARKYQQTLTDVIGMESDRADYIKYAAQIDQDAANKRIDLMGKIASEQAKGKDVNTQVIDQYKLQLIEIDKQASAMKALKQNEIDALQRQRDLIADIILLNQFQTQDLQVKQLAGQNNLIGLFGDELRLRQGLMAIENERVNAQMAANNRLAALGQNVTAQDDARANREIAQAKQVADAKIAILNDQIAKEKALRNNSAAGAQQAMEQIARSFDPFMVAQMQVNAMWGAMSSAIDTFVETGKFSFKDFAKSIIADIMKIQLKMAAAKLFSAMGAGGGGLFGGSIIPGFLAAGGPAQANKPYIVGEEGPELFVPRNSGTVVPNNQITGGSSQSGASNIYVTNNISAVDAQGVARLFTQNRQLLLGTVEQARKELPTRGR